MPLTRTTGSLWHDGPKASELQIGRVKKRLRENGFANISRCYPTLEGEPFYRQDGTLYILEDVLPQQAARAVYDHFHKGADTPEKQK